MSETITLPKEKVQHLFDLVVGSMDFGSGFLDDEDVDLLREIARWLHVDPSEATPQLWRHKYPHVFEKGTHVDWCLYCWKPEVLRCHTKAVA